MQVLIVINVTNYKNLANLDFIDQDLSYSSFKGAFSNTDFSRANLKVRFLTMRMLMAPFLLCSAQ